MPYYYPIRGMQAGRRKRTLEGLARLRSQLESELPDRTRAKTLILGTWNLRNFDDNRFGHGPRTLEDKLYVAEILGRFDVIALQELCRDLDPLDDVVRLLGPDYTYIVTDVTEGRAGNVERLGFLFDKSKVRFRGVAGELVLPQKLQIADGKTSRQFSRTPFMCSFQAGWFKFYFSTVHVYFGARSGSKYRRRVAEIDSVAKFLAKRAKRSDANHILVGDFNIVGKGSSGYNVLAAAGFEIAVNKKGSNKDQTKFYDQISFMPREDEIKPGRQGVFQFFDSIFRHCDYSSYRSDVKRSIEKRAVAREKVIAELTGKIRRSSSERQRKRYEKKIAKTRQGLAVWERTLADETELEKYYEESWRTFHASDHLPLWVELKIDFSDEYLSRLARGGKGKRSGS